MFFLQGPQTTLHRIIKLDSYPVVLYIYTTYVGTHVPSFMNICVFMFSFSLAMYVFSS